MRFTLPLSQASGVEWNGGSAVGGVGSWLCHSIPDLDISGGGKEEKEEKIDLRLKRLKR